MASLADAFQESIRELGNVSGLWNPFAVIDLKGIEGQVVFASILNKIMLIGAGVLLLMVLLRVLLFLSKAIAGDDESQSVLGMAAEVVIVAALLVSYPNWIRLLPQIFNSMGQNILAAATSELSAQISGALAQIGNESASDFSFWSAQAISITVLNLMAAIFSTVALVLLWVMAKLQAYLFAFWYLLGPIGLPTMVFPPLGHVCRIWFSTLLGVSFMVVCGPLLYVILVRSNWVVHTFAAGGEMDAVTCLVFAFLTILTLVSIPVLSMKVWNGIESRVIAGAFGGAEGVGRTSGIVHSAAARAKLAYLKSRLDTKATSHSAAKPGGRSSGSGTGDKG